MKEVKPIGKVYSELINLKDCPLQENENAPEAIIEIFNAYSPAAEQFKVGDNIYVLTWLNKADRTVLQTHPRNDMDAELTGVFSTRSPDRPNPIGLHHVNIIDIDNQKNQITVSALEVLDGTPVIDIKSG